MRPAEIKGKTYTIETGCGKMYCTLNSVDGRLYEMFINKGKSGGCAMAQMEAIGRMVSLCLRSNINIDAIIKQLAHISCDRPGWNEDGSKTSSCADAVACVLTKYAKTNIQQEQLPLTDKIETNITNPPQPKTNTNVHKSHKLCPDCGDNVVMQEGCNKCMSCGWSECL